MLNVDKISIISNAEASSSPVSPNNKFNLAIGLVIGVIIGIGIAFLLELLDRTVKDDKFVTETLGFTILGTSVQIIKKNTSDKTAESRRSRTRV